MLKNRNVLGIFLISLLARGIFAFVFHSPDKYVISDVGNYIRIANLIGEGKWDEFHFFQPIGFPYLLHLLLSFFGDWSFPLAILQVLVSILTLFIMWKTVKDLWGEKIGTYSLLIGSLHVPWIIYTGLGLSETIYTFFISLILWCSYKITKSKNWLWGIAWGISFGLAFLFKGTHVFFGPLFLIALISSKERKNYFSSVATISVTVGVGLLLSGFIAYSTIGKFQMSASAGGLNFVEGKCPSKRNFDSRGILWWSPLYYQLRMDQEKRWDRPFSDSQYFMNEGFKCIKNNPAVLLTSFEGIPFLFTGNYLWPASESSLQTPTRFYELIFSFFVIPGIVIYFLIFCRPKDLNEFVVWSLPVLSVFLCVYIFKSEVRLRMPFDVFIIPMAVKGWISIKSHLT